MDALRQYFLSVTAAAVICGIVNGLLQNKGMAPALVKLISGSFLALAVISPVTRIDLDDFTDYSLNYSAAAECAAGAGENLAQETMADIIKSQSEAYILDKAESLGLEVDVDVTVSGEQLPVPVAVCISGAVSPYAKGQLTAILTENLGIAKENQQWTG